MLREYIQTVIVVIMIAVSRPGIAVEALMDAQKKGQAILDEQLERSRHLRALEYQAEVLERQARIAQAQQKIDKTMGLDLDPGSVGPSPGRGPVQPLPRVIAIYKNSAVVQYLDGRRDRVRIGDRLASGHEVVAISLVNGVDLLYGGQLMTIDLQWSAAQ